MVQKCTKLIFSLSKSAKLNWGLDHKALKSIYVGGILPLLVYGAPVRIIATGKGSYRSKLIRVQRLINTEMAKAYRTVSHEALFILTGMTPTEKSKQRNSIKLPGETQTSKHSLKGIQM